MSLAIETIEKVVLDFKIKQIPEFDRPIKEIYLGIDLADNLRNTDNFKWYYNYFLFNFINLVKNYYNRNLIVKSHRYRLKDEVLAILTRINDRNILKFVRSFDSNQVNYTISYYEVFFFSIILIIVNFFYKIYII